MTPKKFSSTFALPIEQIQALDTLYKQDKIKSKSGFVERAINFVLENPQVIE
jgi:hypothetical protein